MDEAKQGFCVLAGGQDFIRDSMLAAMLAKNQIFPSLNLLVVPVDMGVIPGDGGKGFGKALSYEEEGYVAAPVDVSFCKGCTEWLYSGTRGGGRGGGREGEGRRRTVVVMCHTVVVAHVFVDLTLPYLLPPSYLVREIFWRTYGQLIVGRATLEASDTAWGGGLGWGWVGSDSEVASYGPTCPKVT